MARTIGIGIQDFRKIIENNCFYVDKTNFIKEWWESKDDITLIARPRRFGKTLTMNMLECFFSINYAGRGDLFERLAIWEEEGYQQLQGTYPVISISFADVKAVDYASAREGIIQELVDIYDRNAFLLESGKLTAHEKEAFQKVDEGMGDMAAARCLKRLSGLLYKYYGKKVLIFLDEYDTPMQEAYVNGYWQELSEFMRGLLNATFKSNLYLERAVLTGITRVSKESVFSDLNNLKVVTAVSNLYGADFGFTEEEVLRALEEFGEMDKAEDVKRWYDGFRFGDCGNIYNPWSITCFLDEKEFSAYWANTSSNKLVGKLIQEGGREMKVAAQDLLNGEPLLTAVDGQVAYHELDDSQDAVWSLLLASGYLKIAGIEKAGTGLGRDGQQYRLMLTNFEVVCVFRKMIRGWFEVCRPYYNDFLKALLADDLEHMNEYMNRVALATFSSFDTGNKPSGQSEPERFYHGFVLGLMVELTGRYAITSNRESGFGRYDVLLKPLCSADDGMVMEFKVFNPKKEQSLKNTAMSAINQILDRDYAAVLRQECKTGRIRVYGFAFRGKEVLIEGG